MSSLRAGWLLPGFAAPLALWFPWAVVPSHLGAAFAGWPYFQSWLTKYPNLGPINYEVLLGVVCIVATSLIPFAIALYRVAARRWDAPLLISALASVVFYVPVLVRLDVDLWTVGVLGAPTMFAPEGVFVPQALGGPLLRLAAVVATVTYAVRARQRASSGVTSAS